MEEIKTICSDWVNNGSTTSAMECNWKDWFMEDFEVDASLEELKSVLNIKDEELEEAVIDVNHRKNYVNHVSVKVFDNMIRVSI